VAGDAIVLDCGALTALAEGREAVRFAIKKDAIVGVNVVVPSVVVAESLTGDTRRDARMNATLKGVSIVDVDATLARAAAALRRKQRRGAANAIDAIVVAIANLLPGTRLLTTVPQQLRPLAEIDGRCVVFAV